jgi:hypothetical protein
VRVNPRPDERVLARAVFALVSGEPVQALDRAAAALRARGGTAKRPRRAALP